MLCYPAKNIFITIIHSRWLYQFAWITEKSPAGYGYHSTHGSPSHHSQPSSGIAATIQFPPGTIGCNPIGLAFPATIAGPPKHAAIPTHPVSVGVTKSLTKFVDDHVPSRHPAEEGPQNGPGTNA